MYFIDGGSKLMQNTRLKEVRLLSIKKLFSENVRKKRLQLLLERLFASRN